MGAISSTYTLDEVTVRAIKAGVDLLLFSNHAQACHHIQKLNFGPVVDPQVVIDLVYKHIVERDDTELHRRVQESAQRIQRWKARF